MDDEEKDKLSICKELYGWYYKEFFKKTELLRYIRNFFMFIALSAMASLVFLLAMHVHNICCYIIVVLLILVAWIIVMFSMKCDTNKEGERIQKLKNEIEKPEYFGQCSGSELNKLLTYVAMNEDSKIIEMFNREDFVNYIVVTVISALIGQFINNSSRANQVMVSILVWLLFEAVLEVKMIKVNNTDVTLIEFKRDIRKLLIDTD